MQDSRQQGIQILRETLKSNFVEIFKYKKNPALIFRVKQAGLGKIVNQNRLNNISILVFKK